MELTRQEAIEKHRALWHEIARRTREEKRIVTKKEVLKEKVYRNCYLCEYGKALSRRAQGNSGGSCHFCPLCKQETINCLDGLYDEWLDCVFYRTAAKLADQIAGLPEVNFNDVKFQVEE